MTLCKTNCSKSYNESVTYHNYTHSMSECNVHRYDSSPTNGFLQKRNVSWWLFIVVYDGVLATLNWRGQSKKVPTSLFIKMETDSSCTCSFNSHLMLQTGVFSSIVQYKQQRADFLSLLNVSIEDKSVMAQWHYTINK